MNKKQKLKHICEVCGKEEILTIEEAYNAGWDYPPMMGAFGIVSPRTCPDCDMMKTLWAALVLKEKPVDELSDRQKETLQRILGEPDSILPDEEITGSDNTASMNEAGER